MIATHRLKADPRLRGDDERGLSAIAAPKNVFYRGALQTYGSREG